MAREGSLKHNFKERGVVSISKTSKSGNIIDFEKAEEIGIEAGAEEIDTREQNEQEWSLITSKETLFTVKGYIEKHLTDVDIRQTYMEYFPINCVELNDEDCEKASDFLDALNELPEITKIASNIK